MDVAKSISGCAGRSWLWGQSGIEVFVGFDAPGNGFAQSDQPPDAISAFRYGGRRAGLFRLIAEDVLLTG